mmetsp:Transcript_17634/g.41659  ORF Transcript_17634/g.41659 Transcript_17634/m.41659 type:complete len:234 (+) Transcript_17634:492-1193(+)
MVGHVGVGPGGTGGAVGLQEGTADGQQRLVEVGAGGAELAARGRHRHRHLGLVEGGDELIGLPTAVPLRRGPAPAAVALVLVESDGAVDGVNVQPDHGLDEAVVALVGGEGGQHVRAVVEAERGLEVLGEHHGDGVAHHGVVIAGIAKEVGGVVQEGLAGLEVFVGVGHGVVPLPPAEEMGEAVLVGRGPAPRGGRQPHRRRTASVGAPPVQEGVGLQFAEDAGEQGGPGFSD